MSSCSLIIKQIIFKEMSYIKVTAVIFASTCRIRCWLLLCGLLSNLENFIFDEKCFS